MVGTGTESGRPTVFPSFRQPKCVSRTPVKGVELSSPPRYDMDFADKPETFWIPQRCMSPRAFNMKTVNEPSAAVTTSLEAPEADSRDFSFQLRTPTNKTLLHRPNEFKVNEPSYEPQDSGATHDENCWVTASGIAPPFLNATKLSIAMFAGSILSFLEPRPNTHLIQFGTPQDAQKCLWLSGATVGGTPIKFVLGLPAPYKKLLDPTSSESTQAVLAESHITNVRWPQDKVSMAANVEATIRGWRAPRVLYRQDHW